MSDTPNKPADAPEAGVDDQLSATHIVQHSIADSPAGLLLKDSLHAMYGTGDDAEEVYQESLEKLRERPDKVLVEIARALGNCSDEDYPFRWALIHLAGQLRNELALPLLASIVETPIPAERSSDPHSYSTVAEETLLRTTATEGVGHFAAEGNAGAIEYLFDFLEVDSLSLHRAAVLALLASPRSDDMRDRIKEYLPKSQHFLLDLKRADVREVDQVNDPESDLSEAGRSAVKPEPPRFDAAEPDGPVKDRPRAEDQQSRKQRKKAD